MLTPELEALVGTFRDGQSKINFYMAEYHPVYLAQALSYIQEISQRVDPETALIFLAEKGPYFMMRALKTARLDPEFPLAAIIDQCQEPEEAACEALILATRFGVQGIQASNADSISPSDRFSLAKNLNHLSGLLVYLLGPEGPGLFAFIDSLPDDLAFNLLEPTSTSS